MQNPCHRWPHSCHRWSPNCHRCPPNSHRCPPNFTGLHAAVSIRLAFYISVSGNESHMVTAIEGDTLTVAVVVRTAALNPAMLLPRYALQRQVTSVY